MHRTGRLSYHDVGQGGVSGFIQSQVCGDNSRQVDTHQFQPPVYLSCDVELGTLSLQFRGEGRLKRREEMPFVTGKTQEGNCSGSPGSQMLSLAICKTT